MFESDDYLSNLSLKYSYVSVVPQGPNDELNKLFSIKYNLYYFNKY